MKIRKVDYTSGKAPKFLCQSLRETGFAVLTHHPLPKTIIQTAYQQWQQFFASANKMTYLYQKPSQDGYFPYRTEKAKDSQQSDLKEFYHFYPWGKMPQETKEISLTMWDALSQLAHRLLQWIEDYLPPKISQSLSMPLSKMIIDSGNTLLRILHYPPLTHEETLNAVRAAPHEDINLITLLPAATAPGLEVLDIHGNWHSVDCDPGNIVINVGDMLQLCTQHYYKSTTHRVVNPGTSHANTSRYSMPLFLHPNPAVQLTQGMTADKYLKQRLEEIGIY